MSTHSYSRCWLHLIWETLRREAMLDKRAAVESLCQPNGILSREKHLHED